jgi:hypothetical protein
VSHIDDLKATIHKLHGATATHRESVPVTETFQGQTVWDGIVEVFDLHGHPKANRAYAWSQKADEDGRKGYHFTVLHIPPAVSPETAVRVALMNELRSANATA